MSRHRTRKRSRRVVKKSRALTLKVKARAVLQFAQETRMRSIPPCSGDDLDRMLEFVGSYRYEDETDQEFYERTKREVEDA